MDASALPKLSLCIAWAAALLPVNVIADTGKNAIALVCHISVPAKVILGKAVPMTFVLSNRGKTTVNVLKVNTPLEGFYGKYLQISSPHGELEYNGAMVKRAEPTREEYISIKPRAKRSKTLDLASVYDLKLPGKYELTFTGRLVDVTTGKIPRGFTEQNALDIDCPVVRFEIVATL